MATATTINMNSDIFETLVQTAEFMQKSRSDIIKSLLMLVLANDNDKIASKGAVRYQERDEEKKWKKFHISYNDEEYEYFQDLRRYMKMSLSYLVAYAVRKHLNKLINGDSADNYHKIDYLIYKDLLNNIVYSRKYWVNAKKLE